MHKTQEEDDDRTRIYHGTEMDGAIMYGKPGKKPPMWLHSIMYDEMEYFNNIMHGAQPDEEFKALLTGELPGTPLPRQTPAPGPGLRTGR